MVSIGKGFLLAVSVLQLLSPILAQEIKTVKWLTISYFLIIESFYSNIQIF